MPIVSPDSSYFLYGVSNAQTGFLLGTVSNEHRFIEEGSRK